MPAPFVIAALASAAGSGVGLITGAATSAVSSIIIGPAIAPHHRAAMYAANREVPNIIPDVGALVNAYWQGYLGKDLLYEGARLNGAIFLMAGDGEGWNTASYCWQEVIEAQRPKVPIDLVMSAWVRGLIDDNEISRQVAVNGFYTDAYLNAYLDRLWIPSAQDAYNQHLYGVFTADELAENWKRHGIHREQDRERLRKLTEVPDVAVAQRALVSGRLDRDEFYATVAANGVHDAPTQALYEKLAQDGTIPPIQDLVRFGVREVFTPALAQDLGLYEEYPEAIDQYAARKGIAARNIDVGMRGHGATDKSWSQIYWAAHWQPISPGQAYEMFHRIRSDNVDEWRARGFDVQPFTIDDVRRWLRISDYPPYIREYLAAISTRPLSVREVRQLVQWNLRSDADAVGMFRDLGYSPRDAALQVSMAHERQRRIDENHVQLEMRRLNGSIIKQILEGFAAGLTSEATATDQLMRMGFSAVQAGQILEVEATAWLHEAAKVSIQGIETAYLSGAMSPLEAAAALARVGVQPSRIQDYLDRWATRRQLPHRAATAAEVQKWYRDHLIGYDEALARLVNLGHTAPDAVLALAEAQRGISDLAARSQRAEARQAAHQAAELQKVQKAHHQEAARLADRIKKLTPVSRLVSWLKKGIITEDYFLERLLVMGYTDEVILKYMREAESGRKGKSQAGSSNGQAPQPG